MDPSCHHDYANGKRIYYMHGVVKEVRIIFINKKEHVYIPDLKKACNNISH